MRQRTKKPAPPRITVQGVRAIESDLPLFVLSLGDGWVPALPGTRERARRMERHALWIYGVEA